MPLPAPNKGESRKSFADRCMGNSVMNKEFPDQSQRFAVCNNLWEKKRTAKLSQILEDMSK